MYQHCGYSTKVVTRSTATAAYLQPTGLVVSTDPGGDATQEVTFGDERQALGIAVMRGCALVLRAEDMG